MQGSMENKFLTMLKGFVEPKGVASIPAWLEDLILAGPRLELWKPPDGRVNRMMLTEFLARWMKNAGMAEEEAVAWLLPYSCEVLAAYSQSGMSMIRHGTKANVRWVYKSNLRFDFDDIARVAAADNPHDLPAYMPVARIWYDRLWEEKDRRRREYVPPVFEPFIPVKKRHREQFEKALALARQKQAEGESCRVIADLLNEQGLLTKTGRKWTQSIVHNCLREAGVKEMWSKPITGAADASVPNTPG
jgi:hypothetical protein